MYVTAIEGVQAHINPKRLFELIEESLVKRHPKLDRANMLTLVIDRYNTSYSDPSGTFLKPCNSPPRLIGFDNRFTERGKVVTKLSRFVCAEK